ncbi:MAG: hypothetical protein ACOX3L_03785 [Lutisporaceae bacterium]
MIQQFISFKSTSACFETSLLIFCSSSSFSLAVSDGIHGYFNIYKIGVSAFMCTSKLRGVSYRITLSNPLVDAQKLH